MNQERGVLAIYGRTNNRCAPHRTEVDESARGLGEEADKECPRLALIQKNKAEGQTSSTLGAAVDDS